MSKVILGIDVGGGSVRAAAWETESKHLTVVKSDMTAKALFTIGEFGYGMDPEVIYDIICGTVKKCLAKGGFIPGDIISLSSSVLRHALVALDKSGEVLFASANRDARAVDATMRLNDSGADDIYAISGHRPMPNLMACKLMWLKETQSELYAKIATAFSLQDYLNYKLTGKIAAERSNAGETMLYDLKASKWSDTLIARYGLDAGILPSLINPGEKLGTLTEKAASDMGLTAKAIVIAGAGDTQSALLGLGAIETGDIGMAAGTTAPIQMQLDKPIIDPKGRLWTGVSSIPGKYVIESNGGGMGIALEWAAGLMFSEKPNPVGSLMAAAAKTGTGAGGALSTVGAQIFNNSVLSLPIDQVLFSTTNYRPDMATDRNKVSRAVVEGMAYAVRGNIEQLEEVSGKKVKELKLGGGIARDAVLGKVISEVTSVPVIIPAVEDASAVGAVVTAAVGSGTFGGYKEAVAAIVGTGSKTDLKTGNYERIYEEWSEMYRSSFESNMQLGALINELRLQTSAGTSKSSAESVSLRIYSDADLSEEAVNMLREFGPVTYKNYRDGEMLEGDDMIKTLKDYDVFITEVDIVDAAIIKELPNLRMIGVCRGNPTNIDVDACSAAGIPVVYTPGRNSEAVADLTLAFILNIARMIPEAAAFLKEKGDAGDMGRQGAAYFRYQGNELWRSTVGIVGGGAIGKKVAKRLLGFDARLLVADPYLSKEDTILMGAKKVELDELLKESDIITLHAPVTPATTNMINAEAFAKMKDGVYVVNTARAALMDYGALLNALKSGKVIAAGLDVFPVEPPASDDPLVLLPNVLTTPHIAGNTKQVGIHQGLIMAENLRMLTQGELSSDVINRKAFKSFSFTGEKKFDTDALEQLSGKVVGVNDLDTKQVKVQAEAASPAKASAPAPKEAAPIAASPAPAAGGYAQYMALIKEFLDILANDAEVKEKTSSKDISFQITFKDNEESCYMYFNKGAVEAGLGLFPKGAAEVNLRMPIEIFDGMMLGTVNGAKAAMTGKMAFTGNVRKAMSMQSILKLMMNSYQAAIDKVGKVDVAAFGQAPAKAAATPAVKASVQTAVPAPKSGGYGKYMALIKEFLNLLANDAEVKEKTAAKDISFQITFKDNEESCYMYFNKGVVEANLGLFPKGAAEVNLRMPIEIFDGMMLGTVNGAKAAMTGKMSFTGNVRKAMSMQSILKLMMNSYQAAITKVGKVDIAALGPDTAPQAAAAAAAPITQGAPAIPIAAVPAAAKTGFFARLFGKKQAPVVQQIIMQAPAAYDKEEKPKTGDVRDEILAVTDELFKKGLITGIGGNISARCEDNPEHVWITPSSVFKGDLRADMMVRLDMDGNVVGETELSASSEKMVHLAIYKRRKEVNAVIHSHAPKSTLMGLTGLKFEPISTDAAFIGDVPVVPFIIPGSPELGELVGEAIGKEGSAVIMQNHGLVVAGNSCRRAADTTDCIEITAEKLLECKAMNVKPALIPDEAQKELAEVGKMLV